MSPLEWIETEVTQGADPLLSCLAQTGAGGLSLKPAYGEDREQVTVTCVGLSIAPLSPTPSKEKQGELHRL